MHSIDNKHHKLVKTHAHKTLADNRGDAPNRRQTLWNLLVASKEKETCPKSAKEWEQQLCAAFNCNHATLFYPALVYKNTAEDTDYL
jgi:hypothetical protein